MHGKTLLLITLFAFFNTLSAQVLQLEIPLPLTAYGVSYSEKNNLIFVAGKDSTGTIWTSDGRLLKKLLGHTSSVSSISYLDETGTILTGSYDNSAFLWDLEGKILAKLEGHTNAVINIDQSADLLATASRDKTAAIWNRQGQLLHRLEHSQQVNDVLFVEEKGWLLTGSFDKTIKIWGLDGKLIKTLSAHDSGIRSLAISTDQNLIIAGHRDGQISIVDLKGNLISDFNAHSGEYSMVLDLQFFDNDLRFFSAGADGYIRIWNLDGTKIHEFKAAHGQDAYVSGISYSNGQLVSSCGVENSIKTWDLSDLQLDSYSCANSNYSFLKQLSGIWTVSTKDRTAPDVYEDNTGVSTIEPAIGGCGISLSYRGTYKEKPYARESIITLKDSTVQMVAMDSEHGSFSTYDGSLLDGEINLYWFRDKEKKRLQSKYVLKIIDDNGFEFSSFLSTDYGENWALTHQRIYTRKEF